MTLFNKYNTTHIYLTNSFFVWNNNCFSWLPSLSSNCMEWYITKSVLKYVSNVMLAFLIFASLIYCFRAYGMIVSCWNMCLSYNRFKLSTQHWCDRKQLFTRKYVTIIVTTMIKLKDTWYISFWLTFMSGERNWFVPKLGNPNCPWNG